MIPESPIVYKFNIFKYIKSFYHLVTNRTRDGLSVAYFVVGLEGWSEYGSHK